MDEEYEDIESEMEDLEEEIEEAPKKKHPIKKQQRRVEEKEEEQPEERYVAFYQEQKIGIYDSITKEVVVEGLENLPMARLEALKLNKLDKIEISSGA